MQEAGIDLLSQSSKALHPVGMEYVDEQGRHYVYGTANGAQSAGGWAYYAIGTWDFTALATNAGTPGTNWLAIGVCCCAMTDNYYGWFWIGPGTFEAIVENNFAAADTIYSTANAGIPGTNSSSFTLDGVKTVDAGVTATRVTVSAAQYPMTMGLIAAHD